MRFLALALILLAGSAAAAEGPTCDKRPAVMSQLENKYSERPVAIGVANNGGIVEVLATEDGDTWTIIITLPNGMTCLVAAGEDWERLPKMPAGDPT